MGFAENRSRTTRSIVGPLGYFKTKTRFDRFMGFHNRSVHRMDPWINKLEKCHYHTERFCHRCVDAEASTMSCDITIVILSGEPSLGAAARCFRGIQNEQKSSSLNICFNKSDIDRMLRDHCFKCGNNNNVQLTD